MPTPVVEGLGDRQVCRIVGAHLDVSSFEYAAQRAPQHDVLAILAMGNKFI
jgi:hypothetical protein